VIRQGLESFEGVLRRQQVLADVNGITVIEDFAHHPTAVAVTLKGLRESYPGRRLIAVFEPRSNTSRRGFFQQEYGKSFGAADCVVIKEVTDAGGYSGVNVKTTALDVSGIIEAVNKSGTAAKSFPDVSSIQGYLLSELRSGDVVVLMSNGDFGGLMQSLVAAL
jgi:UDP-N-acetylmuramate: L-alanyl-gamma-D-glutamyl-meso-diaminopimelate ligase